MADGQQPSGGPPRNSNSSHVYPVRSLLTGIYPAREDTTTVTTPASESAENVLDFRNVQHNNRTDGLYYRTPDVRYWSQTVTAAAAEQDGSFIDLPDNASLLTDPRDTCSSEGFVPIDSVSKLNSLLPRNSPSSPKAPNYPAETSYFPLAFASSPVMTEGSVLSPKIENPFSFDLSDSTPTPESKTQGWTPICDPRHPPSLPEVAVDAFAAVVDSLIPLSSNLVLPSSAVVTPSPEPLPPIPETSGYLNLPYNLSEYGLVHLPPLPASLNPSPHNSDHGGSTSKRNSASSRKSSIKRNSQSRSKSERATDVGFPGSDTGSRSAQPSISTAGASHGHISTPSQSSINSSSYSTAPQSRSTTSRESGSSQNVTFKFEHVQDENGNHKILGRGGNLTRCEDEVSSII